jgi:hypothetical protein
MIDRQAWRRACEIARTGGAIRPTLANLVAAKRIVDERNGKALALAQLLAFE